MLILAAALAFLPAEKPDRLDFQLMTSPAYNAFAQRANTLCPARKLRYLHPADLEDIEESFLPSLMRRERHRVANLNAGWKSCPPAGASCPAQHTLTAISKAGLLNAFVSFACTASGSVERDYK